jgi:hypothetical protein
MSDYILLPNGSPAIEATYNKTGINIFEGNPLIEALPPIMSEEEVIKRLSRYPNFTEKDRDSDSKIREHILSEVSQAFSPYGIHLELESSISRILRNGYINE